MFYMYKESLSLGYMYMSIIFLVEILEILLVNGHGMGEAIFRMYVYMLQLIFG